MMDRSPRVSFPGTSGTTLRVTIAADPASRERGLMARSEIDDDAGLLFVFPGAVRAAIWSRGVVIPLSVAFIASDGEVLEIIDLVPDDATPRWPSSVYQFILEVNRGWFERAGIVPGMRMTFEGDGEPIRVS